MLGIGWIYSSPVIRDHRVRESFSGQGGFKSKMVTHMTPYCRWRIQTDNSNIPPICIGWTYGSGIIRGQSEGVRGVLRVKGVSILK